MAQRLVLSTVAFLLLLLLSVARVQHCAAAAEQHDDVAVDAEDDVELDEFEKSQLEELEQHEPAGVAEGTENADGEGFDFGEDDEESGMAAIDDKDVLVLTASNMSSFVESHEHALVEFYAPWCGHCQHFAPEYAAIATELKDVVPVAKIDISEEYDLAQQYKVQGFPTVYFFVNGSYIAYNGERSRDEVVSWVKRKLSPAVANLTTTEDAETLLASGSTAVVGLFESVEGPENAELAAASRLEDEVLFYQTTSERVAAALGVNIKEKRPALVLLKKEPEQVTYYDGPFEKAQISEFILANKLPLVIPFSTESAQKIFGSEIKRHILCFLSQNDYEKFGPAIIEAAKSAKGKIIFVHVDTADKDSGKQVMDYFGIQGDEPQLLGYLATEDSKKYLFEGDMTVDKIKAFAEDFVADKLKPYYKSAPVPEKNDGDVKIVVGNNFDEIVLDESKDVLLEIYAPWCGHCQALEPIYNKLGKYLRGVESLVIAKMDGTENDHPRAKSDGYPTILFYPAGSKSFDPITVETERTVKEFYKFLKKNAAIPFSLPKKNKSTIAESSPPVSERLASDEVKDEL